jgi:hypothetical protein
MKVEFELPDLTVIVRWTLRLFLLFFLGWLVFRRPEQDAEEDEEDEDQSTGHYKNGSRMPPPRPPGRRPGYDPYQ